MCQPWLRWKVRGVGGCVAVRLQVFTSAVCVSPEFTRISKLTWVVPEVCGCACGCVCVAGCMAVWLWLCVVTCCVVTHPRHSCVPQCRHSFAEMRCLWFAPHLCGTPIDKLPVERLVMQLQRLVEGVAHVFTTHSG